MEKIVCVIIGYFIGCIQTAYIIGKLMGNIDIRNYGSGNAGTTNVTRVLGKKAGAIVFICDILKGIAGFIICSLIFGGIGTFTNNAGVWQGVLPGGCYADGIFYGTILPGIYGGVGVILGHDFPFYLKFKGGKGIASTLGFILCINPLIALITYITGLIIVIITKYISACSLIMTLLCPILMVVFGCPTESYIIMFFVAGLAWFQHRENIKRLVKGNENKFSLKSKGIKNEGDKK